MIDFIGNELNIGDYVVAKADADYKHLTVGKIVSMSEKTVTAIIPHVNMNECMINKRFNTIQVYKPDDQNKFKDIFESIIKDRHLIN